MVDQGIADHTESFCSTWKDATSAGGVSYQHSNNALILFFLLEVGWLLDSGLWYLPNYHEAQLSNSTYFETLFFATFFSRLYPECTLRIGWSVLWLVITKTGWSAIRSDQLTLRRSLTLLFARRFLLLPDSHSSSFSLPGISYFLNNTISHVHF